MRVVFSTHLTPPVGGIQYHAALVHALGVFSKKLVPSFDVIQVHAQVSGYHSVIIYGPRVSTKRIKKISVWTKNNQIRIFITFVSVHFRNQWKFCFGLFWCFGCILKQPKQINCFKMNCSKPKMFIEATEPNIFVSKWTETNQKCILKQQNQTDLFQNDPKQTGNAKFGRKIKKFVRISIFMLLIQNFYRL